MNSNLTRRHTLFALRRILRPLARLLIRAGIRFENFDRIARETFLESAIRDYEHKGTPSRARIAALTGLSRRHVNQFAESGPRTLPTDLTHTALLIEVLHKWHTVPGYGGPYGVPLELEFSDPPDRCIRSLVALASPNANPHAVLTELLRTGAILRCGKNRFRTPSRFLMSTDPASPTLIERFGMRVSQLAATLEYNMNAKHTEKRLDRGVYADRGLPSALVPAFESYARTKAANFILDLDNWLASHAQPEGSTPDQPCKFDVGVGAFLHVEPPPPKHEPLASLLTPD